MTKYYDRDGKPVVLESLSKKGKPKKKASGFLSRWHHMAIAVATMTTAVGCGDEGPINCLGIDDSGIYMVESTEVSGNCGEAPSVLVQLGHGLGDPVCVGERTTSRNACRLEADLVCPSQEEGEAVLRGFIDAEDMSGDVWSGSITFEVETASGFVACVSTYDVTYTRQ
jgi:hypothetical protein